jgi:hypothetical protein
MKVRVRQDAVATVYDDTTGTFVPLKPGQPYESDDPFVRAHPWAFESDVERATAAPGEKRNARVGG